MIRTFIAADVTTTPALRRLHDRLQQLGDRFRPLSLDNLHITLKFLGETTESQAVAAETLMKQVVESRPSFHVRLTGLGAFPNERRPAVVWVGLDQAAPLCQIAADLERELSELGFPPERRPFTPHLTLLRVKARPPEALFSLLAEESQSDFGTVEISKVHFFQSELTRSGSKYTELATATLGTA